MRPCSSGTMEGFFVRPGGSILRIVAPSEGLFNGTKRMIHQVLGDMGGTGDGEFRLPALPFAPEALEPCYERAALAAHYAVHARLVHVLNGMLKSPREGFRARATARTLYLYASDHALHCLFWNCIRPGGGAVPGPLAEAMRAGYGSAAAAQFYFAALCKAPRHRGWGVLAYDFARRRLAMFHTGELVNLLTWPVTPLLVCDTWEHAYQRQYGQDRGRWVDAFMRIVNWDFVGARYSLAVGRPLGASAESEAVPAGL